MGDDDPNISSHPSSDGKEKNSGPFIENAFLENWLEENGPRLLLFARQQTRTQEDAEDVLQDAVVKLFGKVKSGEFIGGSERWRPYLYTAIRRLAIDLARKNERRSNREEKSERDRHALSGDGLYPWFEKGASGEEMNSLLEKALKELPKKFSEVIVLKIWGEHTFDQIGKILDISLNTAASRYRYGLEHLKKIISSEHAEDLLKN